MTSSLDELPVLDADFSHFCPTATALLPRPRQGADRYERKLIILDGANIIMSSSTRKECSSLGLLALIRTLLKFDFEVVAYVQDIYWKSRTRYGRESLRVLAHEKVVFSVPVDQYDDDYFFKVAQRMGGVVLSQDHFRDEMTTGGRDEHYIKCFSTNITMLDAPKNEHKSMTSDGHFIARNHYIFSPLDGQFFAHHEDGMIYAKCKERNEMRKDWESRKASILTVLDEEILRIIKEERAHHRAPVEHPLIYRLTQQGVNWSDKFRETLEIKKEEVGPEEKARRQAAADWFYGHLEEEKQKNQTTLRKEDDSDDEFTEKGIKINKQTEKPAVPYRMPRVRIEFERGRDNKTQEKEQEKDPNYV